MTPPRALHLSPLSGGCFDCVICVSHCTTGEQCAAINVAEGRKRSIVLKSEGLMQEQINEATGEAEATILRARATAEGAFVFCQFLEACGVGSLSPHGFCGQEFERWREN